MIIEVNGIELYYEKTGKGKPIILLHGNSEENSIFNALTQRLLSKYTVYAIDSRDHGKSSKVSELHYSDMMEDVAAFIQELDIRKPVILGFSDGGIIGLLLAIKYPDMLSKLIVCGANTSPDGAKKLFFTLGKIMHLFTRNQKLKLMLTQPNITDAELKTISVPTLVLAGSMDMVQEGHTRNIADNIPDSTLMILEGENHESYVINSDKLYDIIKPFMAE